MKLAGIVGVEQYCGLCLLNASFSSFVIVFQVYYQLSLNKGDQPVIFPVLLKKYNSVPKVPTHNPLLIFLVAFKQE